MTNEPKKILSDPSEQNKNCGYSPKMRFLIQIEFILSPLSAMIIISDATQISLLSIPRHPCHCLDSHCDSLYSIRSESRQDSLLEHRSSPNLTHSTSDGVTFFVPPLEALESETQPNRTKTHPCLWNLPRMHELLLLSLA